MKNVLENVDSTRSQKSQIFFFVGRFGLSWGLCRICWEKKIFEIKIIRSSPSNVLRSVDFTMANTASHQQIDHALLTPGQDDSTHTIEVVPRTWSEAARAVGTSTAADVIPDVHGTTTNTDHNSNNYQLTARPVIQHIQHTHQPAKAAPKTLCSEINSCCGCTTIAWIVFATIVMTCAMKYRFTGRIKVGSDIFSKGQRLAWLIVTPFNKDEHVVQKPAQQRTIEDFLLDDIHALNKDCSSIDTLVTTIL